MTSSEKPVCRLALEPPVARLTLDRPPVNVLDLVTLSELTRALGDVTESGLPVLLLDATGADFSAGVDVRDHLPDRLDRMIDVFHGFCRSLYTHDAVTVALVQGRALGGAMELLACCDFVIASEDAVFAHPEIDLACFPPLGAAIYPKRFGPKTAREIVLLGRRFAAREAQTIGLVTRVVEEGELRPEGESLASALAAKSPAALALAKRALCLGDDALFSGLEQIEALYRAELAATEDMVEGLEAFLEKRAPRFKGR